MNTPRAKAVHMGDLDTPMGDLVPYSVTSEGNTVGHPMGWALSSVLQMVGFNQEEEYLLDETGERLVGENTSTCETLFLQPEHIVEIGRAHV